MARQRIQQYLYESVLPRVVEMPIGAVMLLPFSDARNGDEVRNAIAGESPDPTAPLKSIWDNLSEHIHRLILMAFWKKTLQVDESWTVTAQRGARSTIVYEVANPMAAKRIVETLERDPHWSHASITVAKTIREDAAADNYDVDFVKEPEDDQDEEAAANAAGLGGVAGIGVGVHGEPAGRLAAPRNRKYDEISPYDPNMGMLRREPVNESHEDDYARGAKAFADGKKAVPALDVEFVNSFNGVDTIKRIEAWLRGWHEANLAAPVPELNEAAEPDVFAGHHVFDVDADRFEQCRLGKQHNAHKYERYVGNDEVGESIRQYGRNNPKKPIIVRHKDNGQMIFLKYGGKNHHWHKFDPHQK